MKKRLLIICLIAFKGTYCSDKLFEQAQKEQIQDHENRKNPFSYPWNTISFCLTAGLGLSTLSKKSSYASWGIITLSALSAYRGVRATLFQPDDKLSPHLKDSSDLISELKQAIATSNRYAVSYLLKRLLKEDALLLKKHRLLLLNQATEVVDTGKKNINPFTSWRDLVAMDVGLTLMQSLSELSLYDLDPFGSRNPLLNDEDRVQKRYQVLQNLSLSLFGAYSFYKGITAGSQQWHIEDAEAIQQMIKKLE